MQWWIMSIHAERKPMGWTKRTIGYPKIRGLFKYLLNVSVYCNKILSVYILKYYE